MNEKQNKKGKDKRVKKIWWFVMQDMMVAIILVNEKADSS